MISSGMGTCTVNFFHEFQIDAATSASGIVQKSLESYLSGNLQGMRPTPKAWRTDMGNTIITTIRIKYSATLVT